MGDRRNPYFRKLLVGFDGSPSARRAVDVGINPAYCLDAELFVLAVAHLPKPATVAEVHASFDYARERYTAAMDSLVRRGRENGIQITTEVTAGHPTRQILRHIKHIV